jgi:MFS family permease
VSATDDELEPLEEPALPACSAPLWRNRDYLLLAGGQAVSALGSNVSLLAFPLLVLGLTGSPAQAGFVAALRALPYFLFVLPACALVDRWDRKRVMILCDSGRALSLGGIPLALALGHLTMAQVYATALVEGTLYVFFDLAEAACLPRVVAREQLAAASAQSAATGGAAALIGPPLGGVLYGLGRAAPFLADAVSYVASALSLRFVRTAFQGERSAGPRALRAEIAEGLRWLWRQPLLRTLAFLTGGINGAFPDAGTLILIVLTRQRHATPAATGLVLAVGSVGYIVGSLLAPLVRRRLQVGRLILATFWLFALLWPLYAVSSSLTMLAAVAAGLSLLDPIYDITQFSYRLARIPDALQGRVNSAYRLVALATPPLGLALAGALLQAIGATGTILAFGAYLLALAVAASLNRHVRTATER